MFNKYDTNFIHTIYIIYKLVNKRHVVYSICDCCRAKHSFEEEQMSLWNIDRYVVNCCRYFWLTMNQAPCRSSSESVRSTSKDTVDSFIAKPTNDRLIDPSTVLCRFDFNCKPPTDDEHQNQRRKRHIFFFRILGVIISSTNPNVKTLNRTTWYRSNAKPAIGV